MIYDPTRAWDIASTTITLPNDNGHFIYVKVPTEEAVTTSEVLVDEEHIEPLRDAGYIIYKLGYIAAVSGGTREAYMLWGNSKPKLFAQVQADWTQDDDTEPDYIKNKPTVATIGSWVEDISFEFCDITPGTAQSYTLDIKASFGYTIEAACLETDNGTLTGVAVKIGSTAVTSLSSLTVDTAVDETSSTAAKTVAIGDRVYITTSTGYTGTPTLLRGKLKIKRT